MTPDGAADRSLLHPQSPPHLFHPCSIENPVRQETPGEDPVLTSSYGSAFVRGFQGAATHDDAAVGVQAGSRASALKASSSAKHFYVYNLDNCYGRKDNCRLSFNAHATPQELADTYLPAFHAAVTNASVSGLMCSYNAVNGTPACADGWAMSTLARQTWKFDGRFARSPACHPPGRSCRPPGRSAGLFESRGQRGVSVGSVWGRVWVGAGWMWGRCVRRL